MLEKINLQSGAELDNDVGLRVFFEDALIWRGGSAGAGCDGCRGSGWAPCGSWAAKLFGRVVWGRAGCVRWWEW